MSIKKLYNIVKEELSKKYIEYGDIKDNNVVGRIIWNEEDDDVPNLVIDGSLYDWNEFGRMIATYEGWNFRINISEE